MDDFPRIKGLPPYVFNQINELKAKARARGEDIIDLGMGNPDQPTPQHIVDKLVEVALRHDTHRYSTSRGIPRLRRAICRWYQARYQVDLDPETQAIVTIGSKEGLAHLAMAMVSEGDTVIVPDPTYPIHTYGFVIAGANLLPISLTHGQDYCQQLELIIKQSMVKPKVILLNFPANPTTQCVDLAFFEKVVAIAKKHQIWIIHDFAYADIVFDGYQAPSILQVPGASEIAIETYSLSKTYNMAGWRVGFVCGNPTLVQVLTRIKSYLDYGMFTPIQVAAIEALEGPQACVAEIRQLYQSRRDVLCEGLNAMGWSITPPQATMFAWAKIPEPFQHLDSLSFTKQALAQARVAVSPGIGFGQSGDQYVRFSLIENKHRIRQALRGLKQMLHHSIDDEQEDVA